MAQMPIQLVSSRAQPFAAANPATLASQPKVAIPRASYLYDKNGISGGDLRPGMIDQELFKAYLTAARKEAVLAPPAPSQASAKAPSIPGIPNLSPAQLAVLGAVEEPPAGELVIDIPGPNPVDPGQGGTGQPRPGHEGGIEGATGAPVAAPLVPGTLATPLIPAAPAASDAAPDAAAPNAAAPVTDTAPDSAPATPASSAAPAAQASAERGPVPGARRGADGVWELTRMPDKDERDMLVGQKWRVVESAESRQLFLGPDGEFGWDDFVDVINPLQHIPLLNIAYRAITGDEIYGAARLVDFAFGPLAGISTAIDLGFRSLTGKSMAENGIAAVFGTGDEPAGEVPIVNTASGSTAQLAGPIRRGSNE